MVIQENLTDVDTVLPAFESVLEEEKYNSILGSFYVSILQLTNNDDIISQYDLNDLEKLYECLLGLYKTDLNLFIDSAYFQWNVLDNPDKAQKIIQTGVKVGEEKIAELITLLKEIDQNK